MDNKTTPPPARAWGHINDHGGMSKSYLAATKAEAEASATNGAHPVFLFSEARVESLVNMLRKLKCDQCGNDGAPRNRKPDDDTKPCPTCVERQGFISSVMRA